MHGFALLLFGGLVTWFAGKMVAQYGRDMSKAGGYALMAALGVGYSYLVDYSFFATWNVAVRSDTVAHVVTGFMVAGFAMLWDEAIDFLRAYGHGHSEDTKLRRAA